jgi:hypothetical protein
LSSFLGLDDSQYLFRQEEVKVRVLHFQAVQGNRAATGAIAAICAALGESDNRFLSRRAEMVHIGEGAAEG